MPLQFRRGSDTDRQAVVFAAGEPVWTTDTNKLYVGDGVTPGAIAVGSSYSLPTANNSTLGGVKVGSGLSIDGSGVLSATGGGSSTSTYYNLTVTNMLTVGPEDGLGQLKIWRDGTNGMTIGDTDPGNDYLTIANQRWIFLNPQPYNPGDTSAVIINEGNPNYSVLRVNKITAAGTFTSVSILNTLTANSNIVLSTSTHSKLYIDNDAYIGLARNYYDNGDERGSIQVKAPTGAVFADAQSGVWIGARGGSSLLMVDAIEAKTPDSDFRITDQYEQTLVSFGTTGTTFVNTVTFATSKLYDDGSYLWLDNTHQFRIMGGIASDQALVMSPNQIIYVDYIECRTTPTGAVHFNGGIDVTSTATVTTLKFGDGSEMTTAATGGGASTGDIGFSGSWIRNTGTGAIYISPQDGLTGVYFPSDTDAGGGATTLFNSSSTGVVTVNAGNSNWQFTADGSIIKPNGIKEITTATTGVTTNATFAVASYDTAEYATGKFSVQVKNYSAFHFAEVVVGTNTVDQWITQYGVTTSEGEIGTFSIDRASNIVTLYFTPTVGSINLTLRAQGTLFV